jgi:hypothetical protein
MPGIESEICLGKPANFGEKSIGAYLMKIGTSPSFEGAFRITFIACSGQNQLRWERDVLVLRDLPFRLCPNRSGSQSIRRDT